MLHYAVRRQPSDGSDNKFINIFLHIDWHSSSMQEQLISRGRLENSVSYAFYLDWHRKVPKNQRDL